MYELPVHDVGSEPINGIDGHLPPFPKVSTTLPAEDIRKPKARITVSSDDLAVGEKPDSHRSRQKCVNIMSDPHVRLT